MKVKVEFHHFSQVCCLCAELATVAHIDDPAPAQVNPANLEDIAGVVLRGIRMAVR